MKERLISIKNKLFVLFLILPILVACSSDKTNYSISPYSSNATLAIIEGIEWDKDSNVNVLIANLYYGTAYNGEIHQLVYHDFRSIEISMGVLENDSTLEDAKYSVDMDKYNSQEYGILRENAKNAKPSDFKLSYAFNLRALLLDEESGEKTIDGLYFLISYTQISNDGVTTIVNRKFVVAATISNTHFSIANVEYRWWA